MSFGDVALTEDNVVGLMPADRDPLSVEAERVLMPVLFRYCQCYHWGGVLIRDTGAHVLFGFWWATCPLRADSPVKTGRLLKGSWLMLTLADVCFQSLARLCGLWIKLFDYLSKAEVAGVLGGGSELK